MFFSVSSPLNVDLRLLYVPSSRNLADCLLRHLSRKDASLSPSLWNSVQLAYGGANGHSVDLMALPSNVCPSLNGSPLPFFAPYPVPGCSGVNLFAQNLFDDDNGIFSNPYVFPPIFLISPLLPFLFRDRKFWWPLLRASASSPFFLAPKGTVGALLVPAKDGFSSQWSLPWDFWVFQVCPLVPR